MVIVPVSAGQPSFVDVSRHDDLATLGADFAVVAVPSGYPSVMEAVTLPSASAPAAIRAACRTFVAGEPSGSSTAATSP